MKEIRFVPLSIVFFLLLLVLAEVTHGGVKSDNPQGAVRTERHAQSSGTSASKENYLTAMRMQSPGPHHLVVPPAAFTSDGLYPDAFRIDSDYGYLHGIYGSSNLWAPVYLPADAVIHAVEVRLEDWDARPGHDVCLYLDRMNLESGDYECCLVEICSYGGDEGYVSLVGETDSPVVATDLYAYQLNIYGLHPDTYIYGVRIAYGFEEHLPAVMRD